MDIKDFILIAGGMLIAAVVAHGFWIAWRNRAEPLRLDIVPDLLGGGDDDDDLTRFRGELPNGGGRRVPPQQGDLLAAALADVSAPDDEYAGVPVLLEPGQSPRAAADRELLGTDVPARQRYERARDPQPTNQHADPPKEEENRSPQLRREERTAGGGLGRGARRRPRLFRDRSAGGRDLECRGMANRLESISRRDRWGSARQFRRRKR